MAANISMMRPGAGQSIIQSEVRAAKPECELSQDGDISGKQERHLVFFVPKRGKLNLQGFCDAFADEAKDPLLFVQGCACDGAAFSTVCALADCMFAPLSGRGRCCRLTARHPAPYDPLAGSSLRSNNA